MPTPVQVPRVAPKPAGPVDQNRLNDLFSDLDGIMKNLQGAVDEAATAATAVPDDSRWPGLIAEYVFDGRVQVYEGNCNKYFNVIQIDVNATVRDLKLQLVNVCRCGVL